MNLSRQFLIGRYIARDSFLHSVDARIKIAFIIIAGAAMFSGKGVPTLVLPLIAGVAGISAGKIPYKTVFDGVLPVLWIVLFTFILHSLVPPYSLTAASFVSMRLLISFLLASLVTLTSSVEEITHAIAWFISPLKYLKIKTETAAAAIALSLRLLPVILEEGEAVINAQKISRRKISIKKRIEAFCSVFLVRSIRRAQNMEKALYTRGASFSSPVCSLQNGNNLGGTDGVMIAIMVIYIIAAVCL